MYTSLVPLRKRVGQNVLNVSHNYLYTHNEFLYFGKDNLSLFPATSGIFQRATLYSFVFSVLS